MKYRLFTIPCVLISALLVLTAGTTESRAALTLLPGSMAYDDVLDITWLLDANAGGSNSRAGARAWAAGLTFGSASDWRLANIDVNGDGTVLGGAGAGANTDNEYSWMFFNNLGGSFFDNLTGTQTSVDGVQFTNIQARHWTEATGHASTDSFVFVMSDGGQFFQTSGSSSYGGWAVHAGQVPEPSRALLSLVGAAMIGLRRRRS